MDIQDSTTELISTGTGRCPSCGHRLVLDPGSKKIECLSCKTQVSSGTRERAAKTPITTENIDSPPAPMQSRLIECRACEYKSTIPPSKEIIECLWCGSSLIKKIEDFSSGIKPDAIIDFSISTDDAFSNLKKWVAGLWFAPNKLKKLAITNNLRGAYVPFWLFDADSTTNYSGQKGIWRYETRTRTVVKNGQTIIETYQERVTDWYSVSGTVKNVFRDIPSAAQKEIPWHLLDDLGEWKTSAAFKTEANNNSFLGFEVLSSTIPIKEALSAARETMSSSIENSIRDDIGGNEQRISDYRIHWKNETYLHALCPIWTGTYSFSGKTYRVSVNGRNGNIEAERPWSGIKISLFIIFLIMVAAGTLFALEPELLKNILPVEQTFFFNNMLQMFAP